MWNCLLRRLVILGLAVILHFFLETPPSLAQGIITTVAGSDWVFTGDGGPATDAPLGFIRDVSVDSSGNVFAADSYNSIILKISPDGILTVVAGSGVSGFSGDDGPATSARLAGPRGIAVDGAGNLYIVDGFGVLVRKVSTDGIITSLLSGFAELQGVAVDADGNLYATDSALHHVFKLNTDGILTTFAGTGSRGFSGDGGPATNARLDGPEGIAVDTAGNLYIADKGNRRIRKVSPSGIIITVAGGGGDVGDGGLATSARLRDPEDIAVDEAGNFYIADGFSDLIRKVDTAGTITTVAGTGVFGFSGDGGPATSAELYSPETVAVDSGGNLYISGFNNRIRKVDTAGIITTVAGNGLFHYAGDGGPATEALLQSPEKVAVDADGSLYIAEPRGRRIRNVNADGLTTTVAGNGLFGFSGDDGPAASARLRFPTDVVLDTIGNLYIADAFSERIRKVSPSGIITTVAGGGTDFGDGGPATSASLGSPEGIALDGAGNLYIADVFDSKIRKVSPSGVITTVAGSGFFGFSGDGGPATNAELDEPKDVAVDGAGNLYIADSFNNRIRKVDTAGIITTVAGGGTDSGDGGSVLRASLGITPSALGDGGPATSASLLRPWGVAVDEAGNIYIADSFHDRIRKVDAAGTITTVAGNGNIGFSGDGGPATSAELNFPTGVAVDAAGNIYIADSDNDRIRKVQAIPLSPAVGGVVNGASFDTLPPAAGSIGSIFGFNLASSKLSADSVPLPTSLGGVSVQVNGVPAPLYFVSPGQINFQFPWEAVGQAQATITVTVNGVTSSSQTIELAPFNPGIFAIDSAGRGAILIANTVELALPSGTVPGRVSRAAMREEFISIFCTGLGAVTDPPANGATASADPLSTTTTTPNVTIGGVPATVTFSGLGPGFVGLYQVNAQVPLDAPIGDAVEVVLTIGDVTSNTVTMAVQ